MISWGYQKHPKDCRNIQGSTRVHKELESDSEGKKMRSSAVVLWNQDEANPVIFKSKWGEGELPIVDKYT